ncbi:MAG TPA: BPL-N domain-containing protein [Micavibrio sp.]|nr:BPL-N domain-containing protein [Micavibrio sp.]
MARNIVIYRDEGVGEFGLKCLAEFFEGDDVWFATAEAVIDGRILGMADLFIMPGGADLPYCKKLDGAGNSNIRAYVEDGGTYLGVCAGAYYGCEAIEYHKGREDAIVQERELALAPATAVGSIPQLAPAYDLTLNSAAVISLKGCGHQAYYHGGPYFQLNGKVDVVAYYDLPFAAPAIIRSKVGHGTAILSGVHFEVRPGHLAAHPEDPARGRFLADAFRGPPPDWRAILFPPQEAA